MMYRSHYRAASERHVKPGACAVAFGVPLTAAEFSQAFRDGLGQPDQDRFVSRLCARYGLNEIDVAWKMVYQPLADRCASVAATVAGLGVRVVAGVRSTKALTELSQRYFVVTIFAHHAVGHIDLCGQLVEDGKVAAAVADGSVRIVDLALCKGFALADAIKQRSPHYAVITASDDVTLSVRVLIYRRAIEILANESCSYLEAFARAREDARRIIRQ